MPPRTYSQEEVDAILDRALRAQAKDGTRLTHEELVAAAGEVGIPKEAIDSAARELDAKSPGATRDPASDATDAAILAAWKRRARLGFLRHFITYVLVGAMLAFINLLTSASFLWFPIVLLGWGVGIAMHLVSLIFADEERIVARERRKIARRARRERWKRKGAEFERAVDQGVRALLEIAESHGAQPRGPRVEAPPAQVRVGDEPREADDEDEREASAEEESRERR